VIFEAFFDGVLDGCHKIWMVERKSTGNFFGRMNFGFRASTTVYLSNGISRYWQLSCVPRSDLLVPGPRIRD
jgi:hypothetical protein